LIRIRRYGGGKPVEHDGKLLAATFVRRENRFLATIDLGGDIVSAHVPNSGRLGEILTPGRTLYVRASDDSKRKTAHSIVLADMGNRLVSIESLAANRLFSEHLSRNPHSPFSRFDAVRREVPFQNSRFDFFLENENGDGCFVEVKGVTLVKEGIGLFPDAPTKRGTKHLVELTEAVKTGYRAAAVFVAQRDDVKSVSPNDAMDPAFGEALRLAKAKGVEVLAVRTRVTTAGMWIAGGIEVRL
jgi:sugar fermentation stimulation protein A